MHPRRVVGCRGSAQCRASGDARFTVNENEDPSLPDAPDLHRLRAAQGWLELGLPAEAELELAGLGVPARHHPAALDLGWAAAAARLDWQRAHVLAEELVRLHPQQVGGWIHRAYAARRMPGGGLDTALAALLPAATAFPGEPMVAYNLACYLVRLARIEEGWRWYLEAERRGEASGIRELALADEDLREIRERIAQLARRGG